MSDFETDIGRPVDRTAARVMGKGFQYKPDKKITCNFSETPLPMTKPFYNEKDLTGIKFGKFTVIGKSIENRKYATWVCRCVCGRYETRRSKSINNPSNKQIDCCQECRHLEHLKREQHFLAYGRYKDETK